MEKMADLIQANMSNTTTTSEKFDFRRYLQERTDFMNSTQGSLQGVNCDICKNKGVIYHLRDNLEEYVTECECMVKRNVIFRAERSGLLDMLAGKTFDKYTVTEDWQKKIKESAMEFCNNPTQCFFIGGQSGIGKTHLCVAISGHFIKQNKDVRYFLWRDDGTKLKALVNDAYRYGELMGLFKRADVLYIDDFFKVQRGQAPTAADVNIAFELINYRMNSKDKITIISSEYTSGKLLNIDEATAGRIFQAAGNYKVDIQNDASRNYRLKN